MIARLMTLAVVALLAAGCAEKPQTVGKKPDVAPWQGGTGTHTAEGWKAGDETAWDAHQKARAQRGQNEYARSSAP